MPRRSCLALLLAGCASSAGVPAAHPAPVADLERPAGAPAPAPTSAAPVAASAGAQVSCFFGGLYVTPAGAAESHQGELLIKLTYDPAARTLTEETFSFPLFERWQVIRRIDGKRFTLQQDDGAFAGAGELDGEPGQWLAWRSTATSKNGATRVDSTTRLVDGSLIAEEKVMSGTGALRDTLRYTLEPIDVIACDDMFARAQAAVDQARAQAAGKAPAGGAP